MGRRGRAGDQDRPHPRPGRDRGRPPPGPRRGPLDIDWTWPPRRARSSDARPGCLYDWRRGPLPPHPAVARAPSRSRLAGGKRAGQRARPARPGRGHPHAGGRRSRTRPASWPASERTSRTPSKRPLLDGVQAFVLFVSTTGDRTAEEYAFETAAANSLGVDDALILVALDDRTDYIWLSDGLEAITDDELDAIISGVLEPGLRDGDFAAATIRTIEALGEAVASAPAVPTDAPTQTAAPPVGDGDASDDDGGIGLGTILAIGLLGPGGYLVWRRLAARTAVGAPRPADAAPRRSTCRRSQGRPTRSSSRPTSASTMPGRRSTSPRRSTARTRSPSCGRRSPRARPSWRPPSRSASGSTTPRPRTTPPAAPCSRRSSSGRRARKPPRCRDGPDPRAAGPGARRTTHPGRAACTHRGGRGPTAGRRGHARATAVVRRLDLGVGATATSRRHARAWRGPGRGHRRQCGRRGGRPIGDRRRHPGGTRGGDRRGDPARRHRGARQHGEGRREPAAPGAG